MEKKVLSLYNTRDKMLTLFFINPQPQLFKYKTSKMRSKWMWRHDHAASPRIMAFRTSQLANGMLLEMDATRFYRTLLITNWHGAITQGTLIFKNIATKCVDTCKPTRCTNCYKWSFFFIVWLYMFRTITCPSPGAPSSKLYHAFGTFVQASLTPM